METIRQQIVDAVVKVLSEYDDFSESRAGEIGKDVADELGLDNGVADSGFGDERVNIVDLILCWNDSHDGKAWSK